MSNFCSGGNTRPRGAGMVLKGPKISLRWGKTEPRLSPDCSWGGQDRPILGQNTVKSGLDGAIVRQDGASIRSHRWHIGRWGCLLAYWVCRATMRGVFPSALDSTFRIFAFLVPSYHLFALGSCPYPFALKSRFKNTCFSFTFKGHLLLASFQIF